MEGVVPPSPAAAAGAGGWRGAGSVRPAEREARRARAAGLNKGPDAGAQLSPVSRVTTGLSSQPLPSPLSSAKCRRLGALRCLGAPLPRAGDLCGGGGDLSLPSRLHLSSSRVAGKPPQRLRCSTHRLSQSMCLLLPSSTNRGRSMDTSEPLFQNICALCAIPDSSSPIYLRAGLGARRLRCGLSLGLPSLVSDRHLSLSPSRVAEESKIQHPPVPASLNSINWGARKRSRGYFTSSLRNVYAEDLKVYNAYSLHAET